VVAHLGPGGVRPAPETAAETETPAVPETVAVAVALDAPWPLADAAAPAKIALYGRSQGAFEALAAVLAGKATAPGKLPVSVGAHNTGTGCG
jgi:beta-N-acetylhexosaminidase